MTAPRDLPSELARFPEMNPSPVLRLDREANVLMANAAAHAVFGRELVGRCWKDVYPGVDDEAWQGILGAPGLVEVEADVGERRFVFTHRRDDAERDVFAYGHDVTELRAHERLLAEQAAALAEVARFPDMNPAPVLRLHLDGVVLLANRAANDVFGDDLDGRRWVDVCPGMDDELWQEMTAAVLPRPLEARVGDRDFMFTHRRDAESEFVFVFGADVTQQKQAEQAMRQAEKMAALGKLSAGLAHELNNPASAAGRASAQLGQALDDLEAATLELARTGAGYDQWRRLAELRRELDDRTTAIPALGALDSADRERELQEWLDDRGYGEIPMLATTFATAGLTVDDLEGIAETIPLEQGAALVWICRGLEASELAMTVGRSSQVISDLVGVVTSYSYMDQAPVQDIDVHRGIEDTLTILGHKLRAKDIEVVRSYATGLPPLPARGGELNQVWTNLVDNAVDAMAPGGKLTIRTRLDGVGIAVEVEDDGSGIPADVQPRIFDPFFTTKEVGEGTGLGLDVVRRIVADRSRGSVELRSMPGETVFRVWLPLSGESDA